MAIPEHKLLSPSEAISDHMLLPTLSVQEMQKMNDARNARRNASSGSCMSMEGNAIITYKTNQEKADDAKYKLSFNQARVQFNQ